MGWQGCCGCVKGLLGFRTSFLLPRRLVAGQKLWLYMSKPFSMMPLSLQGSKMRVQHP